MQEERKGRYCPYCGYDSLIIHRDESQDCPKCQTHFVVHKLQQACYAGEEKWYDIPGFIGTYQVSTYYRVRRICADGGFRAMSVYQKNRELYTSLRKKDWSKEYNVKNLLRLVEKFDGVSSQ